MDVAFGTLLKRGNGDGPPETFTAVAEVVAVNPTLTKDEIDGTHHASPGGWRQWKPGLKSGEVAFEGNYLPSDPTHNAAAGVLKDFNDGTIKNYQISFPGSSVEWTFPAFPREFNPAAPVEGKLGLAGTFRISGQPTLE